MANIENSIRIATEFVKKWEKLASAVPERIVYVSEDAPDSTTIHAYLDRVANVWTIGWGNTFYENGSRVKSGDTITKKRADELADFGIKQKEGAIRRFIPYQKMTDNQYATLISIAYNAGEGNLQKSNLNKAIQANKSDAEIGELIKDSIVTSRGARVQGLVNRRLDESRLWKGEYNELYSIYLRNKETFDYLGLGLILIGVTLTAYYYYKRKK